MLSALDGAPSEFPVFASALLLGLVHGAEPGHGWPIAAAYAFDRDRQWHHGLAASVLLGLGHLVSSLAVVGGFFLVKSALTLDQLDEPLHVLGQPIGGPVSVVAGLLLVALGVREFRRGNRPLHHQTEAGPRPEHQHHNLENGPDGWFGRLWGRLPFIGGHRHRHPTRTDLDREGLLALVWTAFLLGFVHEEEFEIIGLCLGSSYCLELMVIYAVAVLGSLVGVTMGLIAGYRRYEGRVEGYARQLPTVSAVVLVGMGLGFVLGMF